MNKRKVRDILRLSGALLCAWLYIPHLIIGLCSHSKRNIVYSDLKRTQKQVELDLPLPIMLLYQLHTNRYYRTLFYHRVGPVCALLIGWWRPGDKYFMISARTHIGNGMLIAHPYATVLNAEKIGENFSCLHCTTIGDKNGYRPILGNNVSLGANVTIIGRVNIGNNVIIGAGSVVAKDVPDNCVVVGNPARIIKTIEKNEA